MKHSLISFLTIFLFQLISFNTFAQNQKSEIGLKELDSLIYSKVDIDKISSRAKTNESALKTRGIDPCDNDFEYLETLFKNLKTSHMACCRGESNPLATARILSSIYNIVQNSKCKWDDHPVMWLAILWYLNDFDNLVKKYDCCK